MPSLHTLLAHIVDYAGLFPPAQLALPVVVKNYHTYIQSPDNWMLARIIIPALRLPDYLQVAHDQIETPTTMQHPWLVSALLPIPGDSHFQDALDKIFEFNNRDKENDFKSTVDTVEVKITSPDMLTELLEKVPADISLFMELPHTQNQEFFQAIAEAKQQRSNLFAKIRTGGVTPELIPPPDIVGDFIIAAANHQVGFKATAGLHHPLRDEFNLTYEENSPRSTMHGFLNVFLAAAFALHDKLQRRELLALLEEQQSEAFEFDDELMTWKGHSLSAAELERTRCDFAISFGSCSFSEPLEDLRRLRFLETV